MHAPLPQAIDLPPGTFGTAEPLINGRDLFQLVSLPVLVLVAWVCPDQMNERLCRVICKLLYRIRPGRYEGYASLFRGLPHDTNPPNLDRLIPETLAFRHLERLQLLRYYRPGSWTPEARLEGEPHLERALRDGKGAILWVVHSPFSDILSKVAMHRQGYSAWHLSRHTHGHFSFTRFGMRFLNPIRIAIERRFLADRVVIDPAAPKAALERLADLLAQNQVVSITLWSQAGRVNMVPFGETQLPLPGGPAVLALKTGASLLPVFTERSADGSFKVIIEAPLESSADDSREERVAHMLQRLSRLMESYFRQAPTQFHYAYLHGVTKRLRHLQEASQSSAQATADDLAGGGETIQPGT